MVYHDVIALVFLVCALGVQSTAAKFECKGNSDSSLLDMGSWFSSFLQESAQPAQRSRIC